MPPDPPSLVCLCKLDIHVTSLLKILATGLCYTFEDFPCPWLKEGQTECCQPDRCRVTLLPGTQEFSPQLRDKVWESPEDEVSTGPHSVPARHKVGGALLNVITKEYAWPRALACRWGARSKCRKMGAAGLIVGAKRTIPGLWRLSSTCFLLLNSFLLSSRSFGLYGGLPLCLFFLKVASRRLRSAPLDSAKDARYEGPAALSSPSSIAKKLRPSSTSSRYVTPDSWGQIDIPGVSANWHS